MISWLPAEMVERLQYELLRLEIKWLLNTGFDEHGAFQFFRLRVVFVKGPAGESTFRRRYGDCSIYRIGSWCFVLVWSE